MFVAPDEVEKRDGSLQKLDQFRIFHAIRKSRDEVEGTKLTDAEIWTLIPHTLMDAAQNTPEAEPIPVETIQNSVEKTLVQHGYFSEARAYIRYRYKRELARESRGHMDNLLLEIVDSANDAILQENANKNPAELATQRDYIAGELSRDLCNRVLMPKDVVSANKSGLIHQHGVSCL